MMKAYDLIKGGITTKSDVGTLLYGNPGLPYAVSGINPKTTLTPSAAQTITYTSFGSVSTLSQNNYSASFVYNADNQRAQMVVKQETSTILTRWYPTGSYIKETAGSVTKEYTFIGGDAYTAPVAAVKQGTTTTYYDIMRDYLGNITHVVNASTKAVTAQYSFDAWGRMRNATTWAYYAPGSEPSLFLAGRGFTGHEHLPWFNVINMNGRVYDPLTGVFLSPDNYLQNPGFTQNYNRYAYCLNNPLKYIDPSGNNVAVPDFMIQMLIDAVRNGFFYNNSYYKPFAIGGPEGATCTESNSSGDGGSGGYSDYSGAVSNLLSEINSASGGGDGGVINDARNVNTGIGAAGTFVGAGELYVHNFAGKRITFTKLNGTRGWVSTPKVVSFAKNVGTTAIFLTSLVDVGLGFTGYLTPGKTITNLGVNWGAWAIGGWPGIGIGVAYTVLDETGMFERPDNIMPYYPSIIAVPDALRVSIPIQKPIIYP